MNNIKSSLKDLGAKAGRGSAVSTRMMLVIGGVVLKGGFPGRTQEFC